MSIAILPFFVLPFDQEVAYINFIIFFQHNLLKKRIEYGKKVHANFQKQKKTVKVPQTKCCIKLPLVVKQPADAAEATQFMATRLGEGNNRNSCWDTKILSPLSHARPLRTAKHCLMKNSQFMMPAGATTHRHGNCEGSNKTEIKSRYRQTKSTGSSLDYRKFDESKLEEMRMRHEIGMQYVKKLVEEMKL